MSTAFVKAIMLISLWKCKHLQSNTSSRRLVESKTTRNSINKVCFRLGWECYVSFSQSIGTWRCSSFLNTVSCHTTYRTSVIEFRRSDFGMSRNCHERVKASIDVGNNEMLTTSLWNWGVEFKRKKEQMLPITLKEIFQTRRREFCSQEN